jgi:hypothetical protein
MEEASDATPGLFRVPGLRVQRPHFILVRSAVPRSRAIQACQVTTRRFAVTAQRRNRSKP